MIRHNCSLKLHFANSCACLLLHKSILFSHRRSETRPANLPGSDDLLDPLKVIYQLADQIHRAVDAENRGIDGEIIGIRAPPFV